MIDIKIVWLNGMPRSGTSWLSQIFDSSPDVAFRLSPLFSYIFKDRINCESTGSEIKSFFEEVYKSKDDFLTQKKKRENGEYPTFKQKNVNPRCLVIKDTRYHNLTKTLLNINIDIKFIHIVRNPCGAINSWIKTDREFRLKGCKVEADWKQGKCRKTGKEEFWGFNDWKYLTDYYLKLEMEYSDKVLVTRYEDLVLHTIQETEKLYKFCDLKLDKQTIEFIENCHTKHISNKYAVYKDKSVKDKWETELSKNIIAEIYSELEDTIFETFIK